MKRAIVIQGPSSHVDELKKAWDGYDIIWSTWKGEEQKYNENDIVLFNDIPTVKGVGNIKLQQLSTLNGVKKAIELNYDRVFKWRSDMIPTNPAKLIECLKENVNFLFFHNTMPDKNGYYVDYVVESKVNEMMLIWSFEELEAIHAEAIITNNILKNRIEKINLFGGCLNDDNDIIWLKRNINIKDYKKYKEFEFDYET
jgi:hypothetical protein